MRELCVVFNDTATTEIYTYCHTLSRHDALPSFAATVQRAPEGKLLAGDVGGYAAMLFSDGQGAVGGAGIDKHGLDFKTFRRSEEHTSELQSLMRISYAVFCLKKKITTRAE